MSRIMWGSTGRPHAVCPSCGRVHPVFRRGDYLAKPILRFRCRHCGTTWRATEEESQSVVGYFAQKQKGQDGKSNGNSNQVDRDTGGKARDKRRRNVWERFL
ncbi:MAG: prepilin peptidase [Alicyclobacillus sp.]|nr:prepilin peptidase [Alicyclobacillus sp.]